MASPTITSPDNPLVRQLVRLHEARHRREDGLFLVEGSRAIDACLQAGLQPRVLLLRDDEVLPAGWPPATLAGARVVAKCSQSSSPSGFLAAFPIPAPPPLDPAAGGLALVGVHDPGNLGTLLRCAAAFGRRQVLLVGGADPYGPKVVQSSAGCLGLLALHRLPGDAAPGVLAGGAPACALVVAGGQAPEHLAPGRRWLLVGAEADGLPLDWIAAARERATLPMPGGTESLNAAIAGAIALYLLR